MEKNWKRIGQFYIGGYVASMIAIIIPGFIFGFLALWTLSWRLGKETQKTPGFLHCHTQRLTSIGLTGVFANLIVEGFSLFAPEHLQGTPIEITAITINLIIAYGNHAGSMDYNKGKEPRAVFAFR